MKSILSISALVVAAVAAVQVSALPNEVGDDFSTFMNEIASNLDTVAAPPALVSSQAASYGPSSAVLPIIVKPTPTTPLASYATQSVLPVVQPKPVKTYSSSSVLAAKVTPTAVPFQIVPTPVDPTPRVSPPFVKPSPSCEEGPEPSGAPLPSTPRPTSSAVLPGSVTPPTPAYGPGSGAEAKTDASAIASKIPDSEAVTSANELEANSVADDGRVLAQVYSGATKFGAGVSISAAISIFALIANGVL